MTSLRPRPTVDRSVGPGRAPGALACAATVAALVLAARPAPAAAQQEGQQAAAEQEGDHEVRRGDTLWDLAGTYLSDPFEWQRIYELNRDRIDDPHWIYPGQVFLIPGEDGGVREVTVRERPPQGGGEGQGRDAEGAATPAEEAPSGSDPFDAPSVFDHNPQQGVDVGNLDVADRRPPPLVSTSDFYRVPFVADFDALRPRAVTSRVIRENPLELDIPPSVRLRDRVVLHLRDLTVEPGDTLQAIREGHGLDGRSVVRSLGLLEVRKLRGDSARAVVVAVYASYQEGDPVIPAEPYTLADRRTLEPGGDALRARVLGLAEEEQVLVSTGDHLFLDAGEGAGVTAGDEFAVFSADVSDPAEAEPEDRLGVVRVVRVRPASATVRVVETRDAGIRPGQPVIRVRRPASAGG